MSPQTPLRVTPVGRGSQHRRRCRTTWRVVYLCLSVDKLIEDVSVTTGSWLAKVEAIVASHSNDASTTGIVLEGSALWPEFVTSLDIDKIAAVWLTGSEEVFRQRIHVGSLYGSKSPRERMMIDKFLGRTLAYNARMVDAVSRHGLMLVDVLQSNVMEITERCISDTQHGPAVGFRPASLCRLAPVCHEVHLTGQRCSGPWEIPMSSRWSLPRVPRLRDDTLRAVSRNTC